MIAYRIFKPFFDKNFPDWAKPRVPNLDLGSVLCDEEGNAMKPSPSDDKDAVGFQVAPGLQQFVVYGVQALQGVTDAKGVLVVPPKPPEKGSAGCPPVCQRPWLAPAAPAVQGSGRVCAPPCRGGSASFFGA